MGRWPEMEPEIVRCWAEPASLALRCAVRPELRCCRCLLLLAGEKGRGEPPARPRRRGLLGGARTGARGGRGGQEGRATKAEGRRQRSRRRYLLAYISQITEAHNRAQSTEHRVQTTLLWIQQPTSCLVKVMHYSMQMHGAKPLTTSTSTSASVPLCPCHHQRHQCHLSWDPHGSCVRSHHLMYHLFLSLNLTGHLVKASRHRASWGTRRLAALPYCTGTSRETSPYNMPRGEQTKRHESRALVLAPGCLAAWGEIGQRHEERRRGFCVPAFGGYLAGLLSGSAPPPPRPGSPPCAAAILPNLTSSSSSCSTNQHNTTPHTPREREREKQKKKSRRAEALPTCKHSTAQHSTARCCSQRTPALLVTRKVRPARWRGREGTGEALSSVFRRNKPCEENIRIHRINSAVL